jgi:hypothetical protein
MGLGQVLRVWTTVNICVGAHPFAFVVTPINRRERERVLWITYNALMDEILNERESNDGVIGTGRKFPPKFPPILANLQYIADVDDILQYHNRYCLQRLLQ